MKKENAFRYVAALLVVICGFKIIYDYNVYLFTNIEVTWSALIQLVCYSLIFISLVFTKRTPSIIAFVLLLLLNIYNFVNIVDYFLELILEFGIHEMLDGSLWIISLIFINIFRFIILLIMLVLVASKPTISFGLGIAGAVLAFIYAILCTFIYEDGMIELVFSLIEALSFLFIGFGWPSMFKESELESYVKEKDYNKTRKNNTRKTYNDIEGLEKIEKLKKLLDTGAITQEEFEAKKKEILNL